MNFFKLATKNIKHDFNNYITYFVSIVFAVMVFHIFCSIFFNKQFAELSQLKGKLDVILKASAFIVALFSAIFVWYSNSFFIKRRKKEIATYSLLGLSKKHIARMLFYESILTGIFALICGILLGSLLSKFFAMALTSLMMDSANIQFSFVWQAVGSTTIVFLILFLINSLHAYSLIYRFKLIELFMAGKEAEKAPKASVFSSLLSLFLIVASYIFAIKSNINAERAKLFLYTMLIAIGVVVGTYILFNNLIIILIKMLKKNKSFYYNGVNMMGISQILYRIKGNATTLATIALLSAFTLTAVGATYSFYMTANAVVKKYAPFSYMHISNDETLNKKVEDIIKKHSEVDLVSIDNLELLNASAESSIYKGPFGAGNGKFESHIMSQTQYNDAVKHQNYGIPISLKNDNECYFIEMSVGDGLTGKLKGETIRVSIPSMSKDFKISDSTVLRKVNINMVKTTVVLTDNAYKEFYQKIGGNILKARGYMLDDARKSEKLTDELSAVVPKDKNFSSYYEVYKYQYSLTGVYIFIGMFLGILLLLATGSIIYFKQLMEASGDKHRYKILSNIGVSRKEIKKSVAKQLSIVFGLPLIIGLCHSSVALLVFQNFLNRNIFQYCIFMMLVYAVMYLVYYLITVNSYTKIVEKG